MARRKRRNSDQDGSFAGIIGAAVLLILLWLALELGWLNLFGQWLMSLLRPDKQSG